jgi:hypothetical protein
VSFADKQPRVRLSSPYLGIPGSSVIAIIVSLQRRLDNSSGDNRERQFFSHVLQYLTTKGGHPSRVELQNWMITFYNVVFGRQIGSGGLYVPFARSCGGLR